MIKMEESQSWGRITPTRNEAQYARGQIWACHIIASTSISTWPALFSLLQKPVCFRKEAARERRIFRGDHLIIDMY